jgi:uncharacterized protein (TIGR03435 family)
VIAVALAATAARGQTPGSETAVFDVVSIKRRPPDARPAGGGARVMPGGRFLAPSVTVRGLIAVAYELQDLQIVDSQRWTGTDRFDIEARTATDVTAPQVRAMIRTLLAQRFGVVAHTETRELPVYVMRIAGEDGKLGPQLRPSGPECRDVTVPPNVPAPPAPPPPPPPAPPPLPLGGPPARCLTLFVTMATASHMSTRELTMDTFARRLTGLLGRLVLDRTGLDGFFDIDLTYTSESQALSGSGDTPTIVTAVREQLGLRLEATRAPVDVLVVDRVEPPTEN